MKRVVRKRILHRKKIRTERQSETHIRYMESLFKKYQRNTRMKLARALLLCLQCSHRKDFATLNICWLIYPAIYCSFSPYGSKPKCCDICRTKCPFSWSYVFANSSALVVRPITTTLDRLAVLVYVTPLFGSPIPRQTLSVSLQPIALN